MSIITHFHPINDTHRLAVVTLDNPKALNALTGDMVLAITEFLHNVRADESVIAVVFCGNDKALCAGGDIKGLYYAIQNKQSAAYEFFVHEYRLNYLMHTYPKPLIAWGSGVVMGGGMGLFMSCSHRIVTKTTLMAMPEVSIGLFPDAGGSYFLSRLGKVGLFLGLTGARIQAADAWAYQLATAVMPSDGFDTLIQALLGGDYTNNDQDNHFVINQLLHKLHSTQSLPPSPLSKNFDSIQHLMNAGDLLAVDNALVASTDNDDFMQTAIDSYVAGSPITKALTWAIYHKVATWGLADILQLELNVAAACCQRGEFAEGVRALLIDKDKSPNWHYQLQTIPKGYIEQFFKAQPGVSLADVSPSLSQ